MVAESNRKNSELPSGDPALLNRIAWSRRWISPRISVEYALAARRKALDGVGRRSRAEQGFALRTLGWQALWRGDLALSMDYCLQAETFLPELDYLHARAGIYSNLGIIHYIRNRFDLAMCAIERGLWLMQEVEDDISPMADLMITQANIQRLSGERARAGITLGRARELAGPDQVPVVDIATANLLIDDNDPKRAMESASASLEALLDTDDIISRPYARSALADCHTKTGNFVEAVAQIKAGFEECDGHRDEQAVCMMLRQRASILNSQRDLKRAMRYLNDAAKIARENGYALWQKKIALDSASILESMGNAQGAVEQHKLAWRLQNETRMR